MDKLQKSELPRLDRVQIEQHVARMLSHILPHQEGSYLPPDLEKIAHDLEFKYNVEICTSEDLGKIRKNKILGMFTVDPLKINICSTVAKWSPSFRRTFAHELGHLVLHRDLFGNGKFISREKPLVDTAMELKYRDTANMSDLGWAEWQANEFAMSLLLPRRYMQHLVIKINKKLGISHDWGAVILDDQPVNKRDYQNVILRIQQETGAKAHLIERRLRFLGILEDTRKNHASSMSESIDALFDMG